jgi:hypothetical protein
MLGLRRESEGYAVTWAQIQRWSGVLARFFTAQVLTQAFGMVAGLWLIRALPKMEYAWFTLASGWQGMLALLADSGISMALMSIGGRVHDDPGRLGRLVTECVRLRKWLFVAVVVVVIPLLGSLLYKSGASWSECLVLCALVIGASYFNLSMSVYSAVPKICAQYERLLRFDVGSAALRLALIGVGISFFPLAIFPVTITGLVIVAQWYLSRRWAADTVPLDFSRRSEDRTEIVSLIKSNAPNTLYFCFQGQISLALITWFGRTEQVADVGALGRLAMLLGVFMGVVGSVLAPAFAREKKIHRLIRQYGLIVGAFVGLGILLLTAAFFLPEPFLLLLGPKYFHLEHELFWMVLSIVFSNIVTVMWVLNSSRGWIRHMWIEIPLSMAVQLTACFWLDLGTVKGVLQLGCFAPLSAFLVNIMLTRNGFLGLAENEQEVVA